LVKGEEAEGMVKGKVGEGRSRWIRDGVRRKGEGEEGGGRVKGEEAEGMVKGKVGKEGEGREG
jgi:hypothetical protein